MNSEAYGGKFTRKGEEPKPSLLKTLESELALVLKTPEVWLQVVISSLREKRKYQMIRKIKQNGLQGLWR